MEATITVKDDMNIWTANCPSCNMECQFIILTAQDDLVAVNMICSHEHSKTNDYNVQFEVTKPA